MAAEQEQPTPTSFREALFNNELEACEPGSGKRYLRIDPPKDGVLTHELLTRYLKDSPFPKVVYHGQPIFVVAGVENQERMYQITHGPKTARTYVHDFDREGRGLGFIGERQDPSGWWLASDTIPDVKAVYLPGNHYHFCIVSQLPPALLERVNTDEAVALRETLRTYNEACPYLKEILECPVVKLQERLARLTRLARKYRTYPFSDLRRLGLDQYHSYWLLEQEELADLINYRTNLAEKKVLPMEPDEMDKACLEISLDRMANQEEGNELTFRQAFWLDDLLVTLGQRRTEWVENPSRILGRMIERASTHNLRPRDLDRERQLAEDLKNKLKAVDAGKRRYYDRHRRSPAINFGHIREAVIQEERERQAAEKKEAPESLHEPGQEPVVDQRLAEELAELDRQIQQLEGFRAKKVLQDKIVETRIRELEENKNRLRKRFGVPEM
ncbi:MAG TPA: hypothetical protein VMW41_06915 [Candidatus Bathyarchaeia archaeon]|nr:hypothetical protein [Candidatus Bathyarchaeia archaeon]